MLKCLLERIEGFSAAGNSYEPQSEVEEGEVVIGTLPDNLKLFWGVLCEESKELDALHNRIRGQVREDEEAAKKNAKALVQEHGLGHLNHEFIHNCFWHSVRLAFPKHCCAPEIGLRKDWQVVVCRLEMPSIIAISSSAILVL